MLQSLILITMFILPLVTSANRQFFSDVVGMASGLWGCYLIVRNKTLTSVRVLRL